MRILTLRNGLKGITRVFTQSILSLSMNLGGLISGLLLANYLKILTSVPWGLLLFPGILSIRGSIGGILSSRLGTALHLGTIYPSIRENTRDYYLNLAGTVTMTFVSSLFLASTNALFGILLFNYDPSISLDILAVTILSMSLSMLLMTPMTIVISISSFKKGFDPDLIVYPVISTLADVTVTICYIIAINGYISFGWGRALTWIFNIAFILTVVYVLILNFREREYTKMIKEFFIGLILVAAIVNVTGSFLERIKDVIGARKDTFMVYPAIIDTVGDVGSIVGSTATTKLALGLLYPSLSSIKKHMYTVGGAWLSSLVMFFIFSAVASSSFNTSFINLAFQLTITNLLALPLIVVLSFAISIITYQRGLDPDNLAVPIESSLADVITTISLLAVVALPI